MNKPQLIAVVLCAGLVACLFYMGMKTSTILPVEKKMGTKEVQPTESFNESSLTEGARKQLNQGAQSLIGALEANLDGARNNKQKTELMNQLAVVWDSLGSFGMSGLYAERSARLNEDWSSWLVAANRFTNAASTAMPGTGEQTFYIEKGKIAARMVLAKQPGNIDAQNLLAECIIRQSDDSIMTVVPILKGILAKDSDNVPAIYNLAMLSLKSGQADKAIIRFRKLIQLEPLNPENYYQLGELFSQQGNKEEALKMLKVCRSLVKDKEKTDLIDKKIKEINH